jgi:hypothetical protein
MAHQLKVGKIKSPKKPAIAQRISKIGIGPFTGRRLSFPKQKLAMPSEAATRRTINKALGKKNR